jgi:hypothetical protein
MIETEKSVRNTSSRKSENVEEEEGECSPQKNRGLVTTNWGRGSTFSKKAKEKFSSPA